MTSKSSAMSVVPTKSHAPNSTTLEGWLGLTHGSVVLRALYFHYTTTLHYPVFGDECPQLVNGWHPKSALGTTCLSTPSSSFCFSFFFFFSFFLLLRKQRQPGSQAGSFASNSSFTGTRYQGVLNAAKPLVCVMVRWSATPCSVPTKILASS